MQPTRQAASGLGMYEAVRIKTYASLPLVGIMEGQFAAGGTDGSVSSFIPRQRSTVVLHTGRQGGTPGHGLGVSKRQ